MENKLDSNETISISDPYTHIEDDATTLDSPRKVEIVQSVHDEKESATTVTKHQSWQAQSSRIQSMVLQHDGSIILCDNELAASRPSDIPGSHIEVVEIVSPTNYIRGKSLSKQNTNLFWNIDKSYVFLLY